MLLKFLTFAAGDHHLFIYMAGLDLLVVLGNSNNALTTSLIRNQLSLLEKSNNKLDNVSKCGYRKSLFFLFYSYSGFLQCFFQIGTLSKTNSVKLE